MAVASCSGVSLDVAGSVTASFGTFGFLAGLPGSASDVVVSAAPALGFLGCLGFLGFLAGSSPTGSPVAFGTLGFLVGLTGLPGSATGSPATFGAFGFLAGLAGLPGSPTGSPSTFGAFGFLGALSDLPATFGVTGFLETLGLRPLLALLPRVLGVVVVGSLDLPRSALDSLPLETEADLDLDLLLMAAAPLAMVGLLPFFGILGLVTLRLATLVLMGVFFSFGRPTVLRRLFRCAAES